MSGATILDAAYAAYDAGLGVLSIKDDGSKAPTIGWTALQKTRVARERLPSLFPPGRRYGLAVTGGKSSGNIEILDFDDADFDLFVDTAHDAGLGDLVSRLLEGFHETTPSGGHHLVYRCETVGRNQKLAQAPGPDPDRPKFEPRTLIEARGEGGYAIVAPTNGTVHENGGEWEMVSGGFDTIPTITPEERTDLFNFAHSFDDMPPEEPRGGKGAQADPFAAFTATATADAILPGTDFRARHGKPATFRPIIEAAGWTHIYERGGVDHYRRAGKDKGVSATFGVAGTDLFYVFTTSTEFDAERGYNPFSVYTILNHNGDFAAAAKVLREKGYGSPDPKVTVGGKATTGAAAGTTRVTSNDAFARTDLGNAERFAAQHREDVRYCKPFATWFIWDGKRWGRDETGAIVKRAKRTVRSILREAADEADDAKSKDLAKHARQSEQLQRITAMLQLAQSEDGIAVLPEEFDRDPWVLNCQNGTVELRTGKLRKHERTDLITRVTPTVFDTTATCPRWLEFLDQIFDGDREMAGFVQRAAGYTLVGEQIEHVLMILYGGGRNGKGRFTETLRDVIGPDYAMSAPTDLLLAKREGGIPNDLARLRGVRLVSTSESGEGRRLDEAKVKAMTGADTMTARFMRGEWFDFRPVFTVWFATNSRPAIRGTDDGIWSRLRLVPFNVRFYLPDEPMPDGLPEHRIADLNLSSKLTAEASGILNWLIQGTLEWQRRGTLDTPATVRDATEAYRESEDLFGTFLTERCTDDPNGHEAAATLYLHYIQWCDDSGEKPMSQTAMGKRLEERSYEKKVLGTGKNRYRAWLGLRLNDADDHDPENPFHTRAAPSKTTGGAPHDGNF